jgi:hypothetical protein
MSRTPKVDIHRCSSPCSPSGFRLWDQLRPRHEGDLTDWFIEGPVADMLSMAKEGLSREAVGSLCRFSGHVNAHWTLKDLEGSWFKGVKIQPEHRIAHNETLVTGCTGTSMCAACVVGFEIILLRVRIYRLNRGPGGPSSWTFFAWPDLTSTCRIL